MGPLVRIVQFIVRNYKVALDAIFLTRVHFSMNCF